VNKRILGIDYGERSIGLAVSDEMLSIALPLKQIENKGTKQFILELTPIIKDYKIGKFVWGLPLMLNGDRRPLCDKVEKIASGISEHFNLPQSFIDERMTSSCVDKELISRADMTRKKRSNILDKLSATKILQTALDTF